MLIGLLSATHDNLPIVEKEVKKLDEEYITLVLHSADYITPFVVPKIQSVKSETSKCFDSNGTDHEFLKERFNEMPNWEFAADLLN